MTELRKPLPIQSDLARPFWSALRQGELHLQQCARCGHRNHPPKVACPRCHGRDLHWSAVAPFGNVYTSTIVHRAPVPAFRADVRYAVALVDIDGTVNFQGSGQAGSPFSAVMHSSQPALIDLEEVTQAVQDP